MSESQIWLGKCQAVYTHQAGQPEAQRYWISATVWCNNLENFERSVKSCMAERGLTLLRMETPLPKVEWLAQHHPESDSEIQNLIDHVKQYYTTALGYLYAIPKGIEETGTAPYLHIETLDDIEPLDGQFDVHPPKTVPDALYEPLFDQPEPTEQEIEHYGSKAQVPPMKLYAILDAAKVKVPSLRSTLDTADLDFACLITGEDYEALKDSAPYIVELKEGNDFTRTLFTYNPNFSDKHLTVHLWHKEPGIYIRSRASLMELGQHFAQFVKVQDEQGKSYFFRFYEPKYLETLFQALAPGEINSLFGPHHSTFFAYSNDDRLFFSIRQSSDNLNVPAEPILLSQRIRDVFNQGAEQKFIRKALDFCQQNLPAITLKENEDKQAFVRSAVALAKQNGLHLELAVLYFIAACWVMHPYLDQWLAEVMPKLKQSDLGQPGRAQALLEHALQKRKEIFDE